MKEFLHRSEIITVVFMWIIQYVACRVICDHISANHSPLSFSIRQVILAHKIYGNVACSMRLPLCGTCHCISVICVNENKNGDKRENTEFDNEN